MTTSTTYSANDTLTVISFIDCNRPGSVMRGTPAHMEYLNSQGSCCQVVSRRDPMVPMVVVNEDGTREEWPVQDLTVPYYDFMLA